MQFDMKIKEVRYIVTDSSTFVNYYEQYIDCKQAIMRIKKWTNEFWLSWFFLVGGNLRDNINKVCSLGTTGVLNRSFPYKTNLNGQIYSQLYILVGLKESHATFKSGKEMKYVPRDTNCQKFSKFATRKMLFCVSYNIDFSNFGTRSINLNLVHLIRWNSWNQLLQ